MRQFVTAQIRLALIQLVVQYPDAFYVRRRCDRYEAVYLRDSIPDYIDKVYLPGDPCRVIDFLGANYLQNGQLVPQYCSAEEVEDVLNAQDNAYIRYDILCMLYRDYGLV